MSGYRSHLSRLPAVFGAAAAVAGLLALAEPASAQTQRGPRIPPDARGFQIQTILADAQRPAAAAPAATTTARAAPARRAAGATATGVEVAVNLPGRAPEAAPETVIIRGPDGQTRTFALEGSRE